LIRWNLLAVKKQEMWDMTWDIFKNSQDDHSRYGWIPRQIFWRTLADDETIDILNRDYRLPLNSVVLGYTRNDWVSNFSQGTQNNYKTGVLDLVMEGLDNKPSWEGGMNNYLLPIAQKTIDAARGVLKQDHWRLVPKDQFLRPNPNTVQ